MPKPVNSEVSAEFTIQLEEECHICTGYLLLLE